MSDSTNTRQWTRPVTSGDSDGSRSDTVTLTVEPDRTPAEEQELVARVAAAVAEDTGSDTVNLELIESEHVTITGSVADRLQTTARWSA